MSNRTLEFATEPGRHDSRLRINRRNPIRVGSLGMFGLHLPQLLAAGSPLTV
jgi:hypothetical protein